MTTLGAAVAQVKVSPTAPRRGGNPEARAIKNPVASTPESVAAGKRVYSRLCVRCHGPLGKGDGGGAGAGGQPSDLTDSAWDFGSSDGETFAVIRDGTSADMEGYAGADQRCRYLESRDLHQKHRTEVNQLE